MILIKKKKFIFLFFLLYNIIGDIMINDEIYEKIKKIVINVGDIMLKANYDELGINQKEGNNNIVTKYDVMIQKKLKKELLNLVPNACFIGEEGDNDDLEKEYKFIVDPIDGTMNFSRKMNLSAVSVALLKDEEPIVGICYLPYNKELYEARKNYGAFLNGKKIHVSQKKLKEGIVFCGSSPYYDDLRNKSLEILNKYSKVASDYRRFGSAVIEICSVASGKAELYVELRVMPWDHAAASLILQEAGGVITTIEGNKIKYDAPTSVVASNGTEDYLKYL